MGDKIEKRLLDRAADMRAYEDNEADAALLEAALDAISDARHDAFNKCLDFCRKRAEWHRGHKKREIYLEVYYDIKNEVEKWRA